jgi:hypothetical protein
MRKALVLVIGLLGVAAIAFAVQKRQNPRALEQVADAVASVVTPGREVLVPEGAAITVRLEDPLGTNTSRVNDSFRTTVAEPVTAEGQVVIPTGSEVSGHVILARSAGHISGSGELQLEFDQLMIGSDEYHFRARSMMYESKSGARRSTALIGGAAVLGGLIGGATGHSGGGAVKGALIGGAAGTAASMASPRPELVFEPGTLLRFRLDRGLKVRARPA